MKTGNTNTRPNLPRYDKLPQWSPVMKTGNTSTGACLGRAGISASMEPGHEDREYESWPCASPG